MWFFLTASMDSSFRSPSSAPPLAACRRAIVGLRQRARMRHGFYALDFDEPTLEQTYRAQRLRALLPMLRIGQLAGVLGVVLFFVLDALLWGRFESPWLWGPLLCLYVPGNLLVLALSFMPDVAMRQRLYRAAPAVALLSTLAIMLAIAAAARQGLPVLYEAVVGQQIYCACLICLAFRQAWPVTLVGAGFFVVTQLWAGRGADEQFLHGLLVVTASVIALAAAWVLERDTRLGWLRAQLLRGLAGHDLATGLASHRGFLVQAERALLAARRTGADVALILLDLDAFHRFNEKYGRAAGDMLLLRLAGRLLDARRHARDVAGRLGGGRFGLLLYGIGPAEARRLAGMLRLAVRGREPATDSAATDETGHAGASATIALVHCPAVEWPAAERFGTLLGRLEAALNTAKQGGQDRYVEVAEDASDPRPEMRPERAG